MPSAPAKLRPSELWASVPHEQIKANAKRLGATLAQYKSRFDYTFGRLEEYEAEHGTWSRRPDPQWTRSGTEGILGIPADAFPRPFWDDEGPPSASVVMGSGRRALVRVEAGVTTYDECEDGCSDPSCPTNKLEALKLRRDFVHHENNPNAKLHMLFKILDPDLSALADAHVQHAGLQREAMWRDNLLQSLNAGEPFVFTP